MGLLFYICKFNHFKSNIYIQLIKLLCFNVKYPENWIFIYDYIVEKTQIKLHKNQLEDVNGKILKIIYIILKSIIEKEIHEEIHEVYKIFIDRYENDYEVEEWFQEDYNENLAMFIEGCTSKIYNKLIEIEEELNKKIKN